MPEPEPEQEQHLQGDVEHVALPPSPATVLVMIHAEVLLAALEALLERLPPLVRIPPNETVPHTKPQRARFPPQRPNRLPPRVQQVVQESSGRPLDP